MNYYGNCSVKIYHVCREVTTHVKTIKFEFMDGKIFGETERVHLKKKKDRILNDFMAAKKTRRGAG